MPQYVVFTAPTIPALGESISGLSAARVDAADAIAAVQAVIAPVGGLRDGQKMWCVPAGQLAQYRVDVSAARTVVAE
jgi:hypothetical protein